MNCFPDLEPAEYSPIMLAYIGDCVFDLFFRMKCAESEKRQVGLAHRRVVDIVNARKQSEIFKMIFPHLSEFEKDLTRKARNKKINYKPKAVKMSEYRQATALEALFGYYFLVKDSNNLERLFTLVQEVLVLHNI